MPGANDPDNRRQMQFDGLDENEMNERRQVSELIRLRKKHMALIYGTTDVELLENGILHIKRKYLSNEVDVYFNNTEHSKTVKADIENVKEMFGKPPLGDGEIELSPYSYYFLVK